MTTNPTKSSDAAPKPENEQATKQYSITVSGNSPLPDVIQRIKKDGSLSLTKEQLAMLERISL